MTNYREILRLFSQGLSIRSISSSLSCSRNTASKVIKQAEKLDIKWPLSEDMDNQRIGNLLFPSKSSLSNYQEPDYVYNLAELMVMEGLAMHFVMEIKGSSRPLFIHDVCDEDIFKLMPLIKRDLFNEDFNNRIWQRGSKEEGIPPYFAYSLGFKLVGKYLAKHKGKKASNCFDLDCRDVLACL